MKKKLLFFGYTLDMGGAEKVMVDFLKVLQPHYDITLALLQAKGVLMEDLPQGIRVIQLRNGLLPYLLFRYIPFFRKQKINKIANEEDYHAAIGFLEGRSATWVADIKKPIRRLAWVHTDVDHFDIGVCTEEALDSYSKMDAVITVAEHSKNSFLRKFGSSAHSVDVLYNLIDEESILRKSTEAVEPNHCFTFVNVGRMSPPKRQDRLVEIAHRLKAEGFSFAIQILGGGSEEEKIRQMVKEKDVEDVVQLKGMVLNPYPYIKQADCVVVSSDFEGYSVVIKEALLLGKAIISTDVSGVREVFEDNKYGIVTERTTDDLYQNMRAALCGEIDLKAIETRLQTFDCSNKAIIDKLFSIIEGESIC